MIPYRHIRAVHNFAISRDDRQQHSKQKAALRRLPSTRMYVGQTFPRGDSVSRELEGRTPPDGGKPNILICRYRPCAVSAMAVRCVQV